MDPFAIYASIDTEDQFFAELHDTLHPPADLSEGEHDAGTSNFTIDGLAASNGRQHVKITSEEHVAPALTNFMSLCEAGYDRYLNSQHAEEEIVARLFDSPMFSPRFHSVAAAKVVDIMLTTTQLRTLLITTSIVLEYGMHEVGIYRDIHHRSKGSLARLIHLIWAGTYAAQADEHLSSGLAETAPSVLDGEWDPRERLLDQFRSVGMGGQMPNAKLERTLQIRIRERAIRLLYEVCRVQKLDSAELRVVDEKFINHLFDLVEHTRNHSDEGFNYQLIKVIVALNEQFMVSNLTHGKTKALANGGTASAPLDRKRPENLVLVVLQSRLNQSNTFSENLIFMLNRASSHDEEDVCMQLLVLKLLYLLFTNTETAHYFYTNDLRVLVDVFIRELSDLPEESESLRHTYLRVLHPLLTNTQLCTYPYKRSQIRRLLQGLTSHAHLRDISSTTLRLVDRCLKAEWCVELDQRDQSPADVAGSPASSHNDSNTTIVSVAPVGGGTSHQVEMHQSVTMEGLPMLTEEHNHVDDRQERREELKVATAQTDELTPSTSDAAPREAMSSSDVLESLAIPRTRDKRVMSLSEQQSPLMTSETRAASSLESSVEFRRTASTSISQATLTLPAVAKLQQQSRRRPAPPSPARSDSAASNRSGNSEFDEAAVAAASASWHAGKETHHPYLDHSSTADLGSQSQGANSPYERSSEDLTIAQTTNAAGSTSTAKVRRKPPAAPAKEGSGFKGWRSGQPEQKEQPYRRTVSALNIPSLHVQQASGDADSDPGHAATADASYVKKISTDHSHIDGHTGYNIRRSLSPSTSEPSLSHGIPPHEAYAEAGTIPGMLRADSVPSPAPSSGSGRRRPPPPPPNRLTKPSNSPVPTPRAVTPIGGGRNAGR